VTMSTSDLLKRLSGTLRGDIAPAVGDEYTRTQAFMASVILERLSKQVELAPGHQAAEHADMVGLLAELEGVLAAAPAGVATALQQTTAAGDVAALGELIEALYEWGIDGPAAQALDLIRPVLRRDIDRRMEIAK